ncbi:glutaredoxin 2 [Vibrio natriegens]|uniref:glutaredoxin 2 n=1 Tax=Vibrio natriegens TaxID=691 RepID=UPI003557A3A9
MKLFVFEHCPFCIKAMMLANLKNMPVDFVYLQNHDVDARIDKVGANMVPILEKEDGTYMAESLDIVKYLDEWDGNPVLSEAVHQTDIDRYNQAVKSVEGPLVHPRWMEITLPEFGSAEAKAWFTTNKSKMIGMSFEQAMAQSNEFLIQLNHALRNLEWLTLPSSRDNVLSYDDINVYPTLRNLTVIKGVEFPPNVRRYIDEVTALTNIPLYDHVAV